MKTYVRSWPHTGHVHYYRCYKQHFERSSLVKESLRLLVFLGAFVVLFSLAVVLV